MKGLIRCLATLPFLSSVVLAQPTQLTDTQMDKIAAGEGLASSQITLAPGVTLRAGVEADRVVAGIVDQFLGLVTSRSPSFPVDLWNRVDVHFFDPSRS